MPKIRTQQEANEEVEREGYKLLSEYEARNGNQNISRFNKPL